jgi:hypothetical protein
MDNMKARGWLDVRIPFFSPPPESDGARWSKRFYESVDYLVAGAEEAAAALRYRLRLAKFGNWDGKAYSLPKTSPGKDAFNDLYERFWRDTETDFRAALERLRDDPLDQQWEVRRAFCGALRGKALALFDENAGTDALAEQDARRIIEARAGLIFAFSETGAVPEALHIVSAEAKQRIAKRRQAKKKEAA